MARRRRRSSDILVPFALFAVLFALIGLVQRFILPDGPSQAERERRRHLENCLEAERSLGDSLYQERPDCRDVLDARPR